MRIDYASLGEGPSHEAVMHSAMSWKRRIDGGRNRTVVKRSEDDDPERVEVVSKGIIYMTAPTC